MGVLLRNIQRLFAVEGGEGFVPFDADALGKGVEEFGLIVDQQDVHIAQRQL
jgi:hypothetical protein